MFSFLVVFCWRSFPVAGLILEGMLLMLLFVKLRKLLFISLPRIFIIHGYWILSGAFSASFEMTIWFFSPLIYMANHINWLFFKTPNQPCIPGVSPIFYLIRLFLLLLLRIFPYMFMNKTGLCFLPFSCFVRFWFCWPRKKNYVFSHYPKLWKKLYNNWNYFSLDFGEWTR